MAYVEKLVRQERTGANVAGINADGNTSSMINPQSVGGAPIKSVGTMQTYQYEIFDAIEKYAQDADKAKIENEKIKMKLSLEQSRLDLEEKWAEIPDRLSNTERYQEYLGDKKNLLAEHEKQIMDMKYMTPGEKQLALEKNKINFRTDYVKTLKERNGVVIKQSLDDTDALIEQSVELSKNLGIHDDKKTKEYYEDIVKLVQTKKNLARLSDNEAIVLLTKYLSEAEMGRFQNRLEEIKMSEEPYQVKQGKLNNLKATMENKEIIGAFADEIVDMFPVVDKEKAKAYFIASIKDTPTKLVNTYKAELNRLAADERRAIAAQKREERERQKISERIDILENGEEYVEKNKAFKKIYGRPLAMEDFQAGRVDYDWKTAGDINNGYHVKIFPNTVMKNLKGLIGDKIENGAPLSEAKNLVKEQAKSYFPNDINKQNAFIKQYAESVGESAIAYSQGDINPALYKADALKLAGAKNGIPAIELSSFTFESNKEIEKFNKISKKISPDPRYGHELTKRLIMTTGEDMGHSKDALLNDLYLRGKVLDTVAGKEKLIDAYRQVTTTGRQVSATGRQGGPVMIVTDRLKKENPNEEKPKTSMRSKLK